MNNKSGLFCFVLFFRNGKGWNVFIYQSVEYPRVTWLKFLWGCCNGKYSLYCCSNKHLTLELLWMTKILFLFTISMQYEADKQWEQRKISIRELLVDSKPNSVQNNIIKILWKTIRRITKWDLGSERVKWWNHLFERNNIVGHTKYWGLTCGLNDTMSNHSINRQVGLEPKYTMPRNHRELRIKFNTLLSAN